MACSIIRTGEVTTVFDEGGNVSTLFQEAMDEFNDVEQALDVFYTSRSQEFSDNSGVFYRDATLSDVLRFYTNYGVSSSNVQVFSPKETIEVIDAMKNMGLKSIYELNEVMQDLFHNAEGVFEIDAEKLVKSGYYTMEEVLALESSDIIHTLNRLSKFVLTGFDVVVSDAEYSGYKNTTVQKNMFGAYPFISSLEVKQYIAENGLESLEGTPYSFVLDNFLEGVSGKQRVKTKRRVKDITREDAVERLSKTLLANRVHILSSEGLRGVLDRIGFSEELKNQIVSYRGIRKALDVLNTKTNHRDYGEMMNGIYFGELPVALAFAGYSVFSPGLEEHSQLFRAKIDDSKFVTIDMKGHTPGSDENFIKIVGEERYLKLLEQKRSGEITGMKLINAPEFLHGEEKQVQYVVFDRELVELTASFRDKALQDLGAMTLRLSTEGVQLTPNGFVYKGDVYLNNDVYETETAVHEFSHLYLDRLKEVNPFLYERGISLIKSEGIEYINHVRRTQPNLVGERLYEEALAQAVGEEGAKIVDEGKRNKFLSFIRDLWESIKSSLGLSGMTYDQASKLNLKEYSRAIAIDLLSGEPLNNFGNISNSLNVNSVELSLLEQSELDSQGNIRPEVARAIRVEREQIETEARANGTWMKAPNGENTNLNEEQWVTVRTSRFKNWFGDWLNDPENASKVVDSNGEPLLVYHALKTDDSESITVFDRDKSYRPSYNNLSRGTYFSSNIEDIQKGFNNRRNKIQQVFLNLRSSNSFEIDFNGKTPGDDQYSFLPILGSTMYNMVSKAVNNGELGGLILNDAKEVIHLDYKNNQYVIYDGNVVKSATDNVGTFNVENNDIRFSISNSNTNFTEDETTRYYTDSQGKRIPFKRYTPDDDGTKSNLLQQEEGQGLGESTDFALVERQFIEDKNLNFTAGTRIESLNDVAWLFRSLENEAVENVFVVYIDEEGGYTVQHLGQGGITAAVIDSRLVVGNAVKYGAKSLAFVHNHPSGSLKASRADMTVFSRLRKGLEGTGVELLDGVIINLKTGKYVTFDENSQVVEEVTEQNQEQHKVQVLSFSKQIFSENYNPVKIGGSRDVAELITSKRFGVSDKTEMLVLNNSNEVVGKFVLPEENQYAKITELLSQYGGASVILYGNKIDPSQIKDYNRRLEQIGATILDAIEVKSDNYTSLRDEGILYEPQKEYGVSPQENKTLREAEEQEQLKRLNLEKLNEISEEYEQGNRIFKRLPQREQSGFTRIGRTGIEAAIHLDAVFGANENGAANKAEQERALKEYAKRSNVWVEDVVQQKGEPHTEGQEALVWFNEDTNIVTKSILPLEQTPQEFLDRVSIHNSIFPETQIKVIGFTETKSGELQYIVEQPLVVFERGATQAEVSEMMSKLGFEHIEENDYANNETLIEDLHPGNALIDINTGRVAVIDAIIRLNTKEAGYGGERVVGTNNVSELEKSLAEEEVRQQEVEQENIFKRDVLNTLVKNNLISNDTFLQLSSLENFNVENVSSILRNNEEAFEGMSDRSIGKKLMSITPVNFEHIFNKWGESFSNEYVEDYVDSLIRNNVVEMRDEDNNICASHGLFFNGVKFGGTWKVVKDLKGKPSHKRGGVDIQLTEKGVKVAKGGTEIIAEKGLVFSSRFDVSDKGLRGGSKWFIEKDLKGYKSHNKGGVDIELTDNGVYLRKEGSPEIIAEKGVLILNK